ncbi:MAG: M60 family metallopeptidase, partial [Dysgonamonadaceae bacterium]|nr:M60 family metallopeptidase [Dysgonamonadaceae bacterium]
MKKIIFTTLFMLAGVFALQAEDSFLTLVPSPAAYAEGIQKDIYIRPNSAVASSNSSISGEGDLSNAIDGNMSTIYHSYYGGITTPVTLDFRFTNPAEQLDYIVYNPRVDGGINGNFKEIEVYYSIAGDGVPLIKYRDYNFAGSSIPSVIYFDTPLQNVDSIQIKVKSGVGGNGNGFASCAEMQFFRKNPNNFDYTTFFTDPSCSELKEGVTLEAIKQETDDFFRKLAMDIYQEHYDESKFRVQEYQAYPEPTALAQINKTSRYGILDNPTGIYAKADEDIVVLVGNTDFFPSITILKAGGQGERSSFPLLKGINKIRAPYDGLMYILFNTLEGTEPPVKINIVTGTVNGYFDRDKHTDPNDWQRLLAQATFPYFDVKGKYAMMSFETKAYRAYCPNNGLEVIEHYDDLVYSEQKFQGMVKYGTLNKTRIVLLVGEMKPGVAAYATDYWTVYGTGSQGDLLDLTKLKNKNSPDGGGAWMPAHEIGHVNQTRPGLKWLGMTEITNNILSQYISIKWGVRSRLDVKDGNGKTCYQRAVEAIVTPEIPHNENGDYFYRLVPFWQLKLYMMDALGKADFYKDVYQKVRVNPDPKASSKGSTIDGMCQLEFVKIVCEVSGLDMTEFFTDWGFLRPVILTVSDYATNPFIVKQED